MKSLVEYIAENKNTEIVKVPSVYRRSPDEEWRFLNTSYIIKDSDIKDGDFVKQESRGDNVYLYNLKYRVPYDPDERDKMGWHTEYEGMLAFIPTISQEFGSRDFIVMPVENGDPIVGTYSTFEEAKKALVKHINKYRQMKRKQNKDKDMKSLSEYIKRVNSSSEIVIESKLSFSNVTVDDLVNQWTRTKGKENLKYVLDKLYKMGYRSLSDTIYESYPAYFCLLSRSESSKKDLALVCITPTSYHGGDFYVRAYTSNRDNVYLDNERELYRLNWGYVHGRTNYNYHCYTEWFDNSNFGEYDSLVKKTAWYTAASYWPFYPEGRKTRNVENFFKENKR